MIVAHFRTFLIILFSFISLLTYSQEKEQNNFNFKWDNGFKLESTDKNFKLNFGGRLMIDHAAFWQNNDLESIYRDLKTEKGTEIRRARMFFSGTVYNNMEYKLQVDFAGGEVEIKDAYIGIKNIFGSGTLRIGNLKEPIFLSGLTSSKYFTFMEPSFDLGFAPSRNSGVLAMADFMDKLFSAQLGLFRNASNGNDIFANDGYAITGRISGLAVKNDDKSNLLHLGASYSYRKPSTEKYRISARPEAHLSSVKYLDTGPVENVENINLFNAEMALVANAFYVQGEFTQGIVNNGTKYNFTSYYGQASYFITGEHVNYKDSYSGFGRVKPKNNFIGSGGGAGAWELALRYSYANLNNKDILGGKEQNVSLGVNWYLNPVSRVMFNYVYGDIIEKGKVNILQMRIQVDF
ncbi:MAG: hypothetical protein CR989_05040 [Flavobacteriales bacterium]|nr:MAG: hypothetical protein CR989_05040 [Flavobacteriales bacterium]